jgi:hypothetical protein
MKLQIYRKANKSKNLFNTLNIFSTYIVLQPLYIKAIQEIRNTLKKKFPDIKILLTNTKIIKKSKKTEKIQDFLKNITNQTLIIFINNKDENILNILYEIINEIEKTKNLQIGYIFHKDQLLDKNDISLLKKLSSIEHNPYMKIQKILTISAEKIIQYQNIPTIIKEKIKNKKD